MAKKETITFFDAQLQAECEHTVDIDSSGEIVLTSVETGRFLKFPAGTTAADLLEYADKHRAANEGQVTMESIEKKRAEILAGFKK